MKKGRLSQSEKDQISAKAGDQAALKRLAKKLDRSMETITKYLDSRIDEVDQTVEPIPEVPKANPVARPEVLNAYGEPVHRKELGVVVATQQTSDRVDKQIKRVNGNTVENILKSRPDSTARIR